MERTALHCLPPGDDKHIRIPTRMRTRVRYLQDRRAHQALTQMLPEAQLDHQVPGMKLEVGEMNAHWCSSPISWVVSFHWTKTCKPTQ
jgi:hypothetical protein